MRVVCIQLYERDTNIRTTDEARSNIGSCILLFLLRPPSSSLPPPLLPPPPRYVCLHPRPGYTQGMHNIVSTMLMFQGEEVRPHNMHVLVIQ